MPSKCPRTIRCVWWGKQILPKPVLTRSLSILSHLLVSDHHDGASQVKDFADQVPDPAYTWPFELDTFQKQAVVRMEQHESVFVAAHTSAGKTVVAEYAIALCQKHMTRCIYTSPIKALSNQKYRDFRDRFEDVGLLTGDVQIKPAAACLIMTTEILRSMLYRGADLIRDVEWVIFDEIHYINDSDRGVVWEEVIIMLPDHINIVMLSATVPNTFQFADWVGRTKKRQIHVISTAKRPVPLEHFLYTGNEVNATEHFYKIVNASKQFEELGYKKALESKKAKKSGKNSHRDNFGPKSRDKGWGHSDKQLYQTLVRVLKNKDLQPCVIFTFSKKRCEDNADAVRSLDLTSPEEKNLIQHFFRRSVNRLAGTDRDLPQVTRMRDLLQRGVGVHHGGLLPIMKEVVEMLFAQGLVKASVLFATETFAMGVNMPARCVVFDAVSKWDGQDKRSLMAGEYIQMAGRAGRRGLDQTGTVIIICKGDVPDRSVLHSMMLGKPTKLESRFRLTYNMILNLVRVEELRVEDMIRRSFGEITTQQNFGEREDELEETQGRLATLDSGEKKMPADFQEFYELTRLWSNESGQSRSLFLVWHARGRESIQGLKAFSLGRVVVVNSGSYRNALAIVLGWFDIHTGESIFQMLVLVEAQGKEQPAEPGDLLPLPLTILATPERDYCQSLAVELLNLAHKYNKVIALLCQHAATGIRQRQGKGGRLSDRSLGCVESELSHTYASGLPVVDIQKDLKIKELALVECNRDIHRLLEQLRNFPCTEHPNFVQLYAHYHERKTLEKQVQELEHKLSDANLRLLPEYEQRMHVLERLDYISSEQTVLLKGRVACEITTCDEVLATELVFGNHLNNLEPEEIVALLSALVFQERRVSAPTLTGRLEANVEVIKGVATRVAETQLACGMNTPVDEYLETLHFGLVEVVYEWACGMPFKQITGLTDVLEGSIVRCITRLDETCRDIRNAAHVVGDPRLFEKMQKASDLIKRDIVFAGSLYTA
ncbi:uncharacterized protein MONBRDRAFT_13948 [Monosiga brevicollis MX1]|uniref:Uncharacterized protein n=1 Tax=Monosiga brevicollis TaxID=81824 RepID=A9UQ39_MONBE|nr:uncharacterized protein MONBRDRAFT_13948 [Monosiga brevicollis MX1]EDQ92980.1 predicted protein [Monosiga brevicollis MX1]|eukprot:XP_001742742.1 hypothetical protein [Monosiga brevicollis MX1]